jgi:hypothetical protein
MAKKSNSNAPQPKSYAERLDPGGEVGKQAAGIAALAGSPFGRVLRWLGVEQETLDQAKEAVATYRRLVSEPDRIAPLLAPLGWVFHGCFSNSRSRASLSPSGSSSSIGLKSAALPQPRSASSREASSRSDVFCDGSRAIDHQSSASFMPSSPTSSLVERKRDFLFRCARWPGSRPKASESRAHGDEKVGTADLL